MLLYFDLFQGLYLSINVIPFASMFEIMSWDMGTHTQSEL